MSPQGVPRSFNGGARGVQGGFAPLQGSVRAYRMQFASSPSAGISSGVA